MKWILLMTGLVFGISGCVRTQPQFIVVTSTPPVLATASPLGSVPNEIHLTATAPLVTATIQLPEVTATSEIYVVQSGDTLTGIAAAHNVSLEQLLVLNSISDPNLISVGQIILLPPKISSVTSSMVLLPDSRIVRGPGSDQFDVTRFVDGQPGFISKATDLIGDQVFTASEIIERVSREFSVDPRILIAFLEFRSGWCSQQIIKNETFKDYPLGITPDFDGIDRRGLYRQLAWAANQLNKGYYGWKYTGLSMLEFSDGKRIRIADSLNAGTVALLYLLSRGTDVTQWENDSGQDGFMRVYRAYFDIPDVYPPDLMPIDLVQPDFILPFEPNQVWYFTGGPHGGWGSGSAWSAVDFAPPDDRTDADPLCYLSEHWVTAVAPGVIARSEDGVVVLDLDFDRDETTGWSVLYLHIGSEGRVTPGQQVQAGDRIGRASCEGGFSNATHVHLARRYNGEWIPAECDGCTMRFPTVPFLLSEWRVYGIANQEYQGYLLKDGEQRVANQGRQNPSNHISR